MARPSQRSKEVLEIRYANELLDGMAAGTVDPSVVRDINKLPKERRKVVLDRAVELMLGDRAAELTAALQAQVNAHEAAAKAERAKVKAAADKKTQALTAVAKRLHTLRKIKKAGRAK